VGSFIPSNAAEREEMLKTVGVPDVEALYSAVPAGLLLKREDLHLPDGVSEMEAYAALEQMAGKNTVFRSIFRGAGAYDHYIPAIVKRVTSKEQFLTAYTPYQAEISQGVLQGIYEYQTEICALTGMAAANASVYDGATALAEAATMCRSHKRTVTLLAETVSPEVRKVVETYCWGAGVECRLVPAREGRIDPEALQGMLDDSCASFLFAQPNFYGILEDSRGLIEAAHAAGARAVMSVNPISLGMLESPGEVGADIAVGEGQPLGMPLGFGGPYLGFMAAGEDLVRKLPGRIVGQTHDGQGRRAFVLTLQAREQHIRREKASSNICSNEALCALTAAAYLAAVGPRGLKQVAQLCYQKAHYLQAQLAQIGYRPVYDQPFFHEFLTTAPIGAETALAALQDQGILGGLPTEQGILWCCTEKNTKAQIDEMVSILKEAA
jgi:glycine dehydrogenase subunit 1